MPHPYRLMRTAASAAVFLIVLAGSRCVLAEPEPIAPWAARPAGARTHDGFYFRVANGFGGYDERISSGEGEAEINARNRGIGALGELALGGTIAPGWVLGGGIYSCDLLATTLRNDGAAVPEELDPGLRNVSLIGPFVDVYLDPRRGLHLQGAIGLATLTPRVFGHAATERSEYLALGAGLMFGAGYDFWIADEWSLGVLARSTLAFVGGEDELAASFRHLVVTSPGLLVTLTYH
jgi:hypothetical protein